MAAEAGRHRAIKRVHPELDAGNQIIDLADPQQVTRQCLAVAAEFLGGEPYDLIHLRLLGPQRPADCDPRTAALRDGPRRSAAQILVHPALHDPVHELPARPVLGVPAQAAL